MKKLMANQKIEIIWDSVVEDVIGDIMSPKMFKVSKLKMLKQIM